MTGDGWVGLHLDIAGKVSREHMAYLPYPPTISHGPIYKASTHSSKEHQPRKARKSEVAAKKDTQNVPFVNSSCDILFLSPPRREEFGCSNTTAVHSPPKRPNKVAAMDRGHFCRATKHKGHHVNKYSE